MKNGTDVMTEVELTTVMTDAPLTRTLEKQVCSLPATHCLKVARRLFCLSKFMPLQTEAKYVLI